MTCDLSIIQFSVYFKKRPLLDSIHLEIPRHSITTILGSSGAGKSTLLRSVNRLLEEEPGFTWEGGISVRGRSIFELNKFDLRRRIGIVFQRPVIFPVSIRRNVLFGIGAIKKMKSGESSQIVETCLSQAGLWSEVHDRLESPAQELSIGQQQRLTIARSLAVEPEILLMDEPTSALDANTAYRIEELMKQLKKSHTIVLVTHDLNLASRVSDKKAELIMVPGAGSRLNSCS